MVRIPALGRVELLGCLVAIVAAAGQTSDNPHRLKRAPVVTTGFADATALEASYRAWKANYVHGDDDRRLELAVGWFKGLSTEKSRAHGSVTLDLGDGSVSARIEGLPTSEQWELWLIENASGGSVQPGPNDRYRRVGALVSDGDVARLQARVDRDRFAQFEPDLVVIARAGQTPITNRVLVGTTTLFDRLYRRERRERVAGAPTEANGWRRLQQTLMPVVHAGGAATAGSPGLVDIVKRGRQIFRTETFNGNGRTCETCHRENDNFTIDPQFIATLPADDPLFVAEQSPDLASHFENPRLMRELGLILLNTDGFEDLNNKFVLRGVPSLLAVSTSIRALDIGGGNSFDGTTLPPNDRLGYAGDGAPGTGTLREFAIGAITQHMTRTLARVPGADFRLPTNDELDALEAFQRSLGRQSDPDLRALRLKSVVAEKGRQIFLSPTTGKCFFCHSNGGATLDGGLAKGVNANFNIGVQALPDIPADLTGELNPPDAGFGKAPNPNGGFGNGTFNTLTVIEAADTGPYFHNNSIPTLEGAVEFYNSAAFNNSPIPPGLRGIHLESTQVSAVASLLRVLNALENVRSTIDLAGRARSGSGAEARELLVLAISDLDDAVTVLRGGILHQDAQAKLARARAYLLAAQLPIVGNALIDRALTWLNRAHDDMVFPPAAPPGQ